MLLADFETGTQRASQDIQALNGFKEKCRSFFVGFRAELPKLIVDGKEFFWLQMDWSLEMVVMHGAEKNVVASATVDVGSQQVLFQDFRETPLYPLPINEKSWPVLATYFGVAAKWFVSGRSFKDLPGYRHSIRLALGEHE